MMATGLPPTAEELEELGEAFRRDPGRAFVVLGEALLALGRPRDAVEVGAHGLQMDPDNLDGRLMVARAFVALHQWKEAQAELLRVVKSDRNHGAAFRMLGEVLMRRADFDRALPVLQHAQNLNPADASILSLLRRARAGQTLDPPPPIPTPLEPASSGRGGARRSRHEAAASGHRNTAGHGAAAESGPYSLDAVPGRGGEGRDLGSDPEWAEDPASLGRMKLERVERRREGRDGRRAPVEGQVWRSDDRGSDQLDRRPVEHHVPPPTEDVFAPLGQDPIRERMPPHAGGSPTGGFPSNPPGPGPGPVHAPPAYAMPTAKVPPAGFPPGPGPMGMPPPAAMPPPAIPPFPASLGQGPTMRTPPGTPGAVRPRVVSVEKPRDAALASLRQSAAVGEQYLNNLLTGGLLDIPRVRVPDVPYDLSPGRRWGRSAVRVFLYLFVILFVGAGGAGAWYWYADKQRVEDVTRHLETAMVQIDDGEYEGLAKADEEARAAVERDRNNTYPVAVLAEITALETFLYGEINPAEVQRAIELASQEIDKPGERGFRELVLARAAHALAILPSLEQGADSRLLEVRRGLEKWLEGHKDDLMAHWLFGHTLWAGGDRQGARAAFELADKGGAGPAVAATSLADMMLDDGDFESARAVYDRVLKKSPRHSWAFIGRSLTRSERSAEIQEAVADINVGVAQKRGPRVEAWKQLAMASAYLAQEDYEGFAESLDKAVDVADPRFLARVGLLRVQQGQLADAAKARSLIRWYADKPQPDPLVLPLDAELRLASGMAREAFAAVEKHGGLRPGRLRGRALFDLDKPTEALAELDNALQVAPRDMGLQVWAESARLLATTGEERRKAEERLDSLGRQSKSKGSRVPQAVALARAGRRPLARELLELSLKGVTIEYPNPFAYRAHAVLADIDLAEGKLESAATHIDKALELNAGYLPAHDLACRLLVESSVDKARPHCVEVVKAEMASAYGELAFVRAVTPARTAEDTKAAGDALRRAKQKGASTEDLQQYIPLVDTALFGELGIPEPRRGR